MKITKRHLRRIIREEKAVLEQSWRQNPAKIRRQRRQKDRQRMIDQMTFKQLKSRAFDAALGIQGRLDTGQYEYADIWEAEIPGLADTIDAAKVKAAEEGVTYDDIPEVIHNGGIVDLSRYSLGLPDMVKENTMKVTKSELRQIIKEELQRLNEEESDYYRDYKAGTISRREYEELVDRFQGRGSTAPRGKTKPSDFAVRTIPASAGVKAAQKKINDAMTGMGLTNAMLDYSKIRDYLEKGYKDHPEYDGRDWDLAASSKMKSIDRQLD